MDNLNGEDVMTNEQMLDAKVLMQEYLADGMDADIALRMAIWVVKDGISMEQARDLANSIDLDG
jgi:hypothetical protein